jgi:hypothetical protein
LSYLGIQEPELAGVFRDDDVEIEGIVPLSSTRDEVNFYCFQGLLMLMEFNVNFRWDIILFNIWKYLFFNAI